MVHKELKILLIYVLCVYGSREGERNGSLEERTMELSRRVVKVEDISRVN